MSLSSVVKDLRKFNAVRRMDEVIGEDRTRQLIISLNTWTQLYDEGIDSEGVRLSSIGGEYASSTMQRVDAIGNRKSSPSSVNLFDSGDFYKSFKAEPMGQGKVQLTADTRKPDNDLADRYGENLAGLTNENNKKVQEFVVGIVLDDLLRILL
jgi:hypothetical protein